MICAARLQNGRANGKGNYTFLYDEYLLRGVFVQSYRTDGRRVNPDK
jgi:hypothetical protein